MEKQKKQLIALLVILIAAVILFLLLSHSSNEESEAASTEESYVVNDLEAANVTKLIFTNSAATISLTKVSDEWVFEDDKTIDIDESVVEDLLEEVAPLSSENRIENVEDLSIYGLDSPARTIMVSDGEQTCTILVGDFNEITSTYYICTEEELRTVYTAEYNTVYAFEVTVDDLTAEEIETETETEKDQ